MFDSNYYTSVAALIPPKQERQSHLSACGAMCPKCRSERVRIADAVVDRGEGGAIRIDVHLICDEGHNTRFEMWSSNGAVSTSVYVGADGDEGPAFP